MNPFPQYPYTADYIETMHFLVKSNHEDNYNIGVIVVAFSSILPRNNGVIPDQDSTVLQVIKADF